MCVGMCRCVGVCVGVGVGVCMCVCVGRCVCVGVCVGRCVCLCRCVCVARLMKTREFTHWIGALITSLLKFCKKNLPPTIVELTDVSY